MSKSKRKSKAFAFSLSPVDAKNLFRCLHGYRLLLNDLAVKEIRERGLRWGVQYLTNIHLRDAADVDGFIKALSNYLPPSARDRPPSES